LGTDDDPAVLGEIEGVEFGGFLQRDARDVADGAGGLEGERGVDQEQLALGGDATEHLVDLLCLPLGGGEFLDDGKLTGRGAVEKRAAERQLLHLAVDFLGIVAGFRAENHAATNPEGRADGTGARAAGALLTPRLLAATAD